MSAETIRFADKVSAARYPLPASTALTWRVGDGAVTAAIDMPACAGGRILIPSVAVYPQGNGFQLALEVDGAAWPLRPVPGNRDSGPHTGATADRSWPDHTPGGNSVSTHIDCFHTERDLPPGRLLIRLARTEPPRRHLVALSSRPLEIDPAPPRHDRIVLQRPPAISQLQAPAAIRERICSPTALAMALLASNPDITWQSVVDACFDGRFYGSWPMAIHCASGHGRIGAVEAVSCWDPVLTVLRAGSPVVASIRFGRNELPSAPLASTQGHLVTVYGVDGDRVLVNDPAAPDDASVPRCYELAAFTRAWLRHRGAAYFLAPP